MMIVANVADFSTTLTGVMHSIDACISALIAPGQSEGLGTKKTAVSLGMGPSPAAMNVGHKIYFNGQAILEVRDTEHGRGVFTLVDFPRRRMDVILAKGQVLLSSECQPVNEMRYTWSRHPDAQFVFSQFVEERANIARLINSSRNYGVANCKITWIANGMVPMVTTTRSIPANTQLLIDYEMI